MMEDVAVWVDLLGTQIGFLGRIISSPDSQCLSIAVCWTGHSGFPRDIFHRSHKSWLTQVPQRPTLQGGKPRPLGGTKELPKSHGKQVEVSELEPRIHGLYHHRPHFSQTPVLVILIHQTIFNGQTSALVIKHSP